MIIALICFIIYISILVGLLVALKYNQKKPKYDLKDITGAVRGQLGMFDTHYEIDLDRSKLKKPYCKF